MILTGWNASVPQAVRGPTENKKLDVPRITDRATSSMTNPRCSTAKVERMKRCWDSVKHAQLVCFYPFCTSSKTVHAIGGLPLDAKALQAQPA